MKSIFTIPDKGRFLRLLDLSLRAPVLSTKLIAAFIKRISRVAVGYGAAFAPEDLMFIVSFVANLIKRHPRCFKLLSRKVGKDGSMKQID